MAEILFFKTDIYHYFIDKDRHLQMYIDYSMLGDSFKSIESYEHFPC